MTTPKRQSKAQIIEEILLADAPIREFIRAFHMLLAQENEKRVISKKRTELERKTDALGRLLTGDEACAAVAIDGEKIFIGSNRNDHSTGTLSVKLIGLIVRAGSTQDNMRIAGRFEIKTKTKTFTLISRNIEYNRLNSLPPIETLSPSFIDAYYYFGGLKPEEQIIEFIFPYTGSDTAHEIAEYPYPITVRISLSKTIPGILFEGISDKDWEITDGLKAPIFKFTLDPLRRRAETIFGHLGLIALYNLKGRPEVKLDFQGIVSRNRVRVIMQTLAWEAPSWFGSMTDKLREYEYVPPPGVKGKTRKTGESAWKKKKQELQHFHDFIKEMTEDLLRYLHPRELLNKSAYDRLTKKARANPKVFFSRHALKYHISESIAKWVKEKKEQIDKGTLTNLPEFMVTAKEKAKTFFDRTKLYFYDLLKLETFVTEEAMKNLSIAEVIASIGAKLVIENLDDSLLLSNSFFKKGASIEIIDELANGVHVELRLFYHLKAHERLQHNVKLPYFGITSLCCVNCHQFLRSFGVDYVEGKRYRAGTHAQHYPNWVFDPVFQQEEYLQKFFGKTYEIFNRLSGEFTYNGVTKSKKSWALYIIEDLGTLEPEALSKLGFGDKIWPAGITWETSRAYESDDEDDSSEFTDSSLALAQLPSPQKYELGQIIGIDEDNTQHDFVRLFTSAMDEFGQINMCGINVLPVPSNQELYDTISYILQNPDNPNHQLVINAIGQDLPHICMINHSIIKTPEIKEQLLLLFDSLEKSSAKEDTVPIYQLIFKLCTTQEACRDYIDHLRGLGEEATINEISVGIMIAYMIIKRLNIRIWRYEADDERGDQPFCTVFRKYLPLPLESGILDVLYLRSNHFELMLPKSFIEDDQSTPCDLISKTSSQFEIKCTTVKQAEVKTQPPKSTGLTTTLLQANQNFSQWHLLHQQAKFQEAYECLTKGLNLLTESFHSFKYEVFGLDKLEKYTEALKIVAQIPNDPTSIFWYKFINGKLCYEREEYGAALHFFNEAMSINYEQERSQFWLDLTHGIFLIKGIAWQNSTGFFGNNIPAAERYKQALEIFQTCLRKNPNHIEALFWVNYSEGCLLYENMNYKAAEQKFEESLKLKPDHIDARHWKRFTHGIMETTDPEKYHDPSIMPQ